MIEPDPSRTEAPKRSEIVGRMVARLVDENFGTGPLAELRRLDPDGRLNEPTLHRLLARHVPDEWLIDPAAVRAWALVIHCLALAASDKLGGETRLGAALQAAGFSETRFVNLLDADAAELRIRLPRAVRFLVHRGGRLHSLQLADLVLTRPDQPFHDILRQRIAADYYRAEQRASQADDSAAA